MRLMQPDSSDRYSQTIENNIIEVWHDKRVPEVLLSGHHANIDKWRLEQALQRTKERRPEMYEAYMEEHPPKPPKKRRNKRKKSNEMAQNAEEM